MSIKKISTGLTLALLLSSGVASADYNSAYSAYESGDYKTAFKEMLPVAEEGHVDAQYWVADMYRKGKGIQKNLSAAAQWYTKSAEQGDRWAQANLGFMYDFGEGVLENDKTAVKWYTKAAEQGDADAQSNLGLMYVTGSGVLTDNRRAYMWWNLGAFNGSENASNNKDKLAKKMAPADISKAQGMSSRCLESGYTDC